MRLHSPVNPYVAARGGVWGWVHMHMYVGHALVDLQCECRAAASYMGLHALSWPWCPGRRHVYHIQCGGSQDLASPDKKKAEGTLGRRGKPVSLEATAGEQGWLCCVGEMADIS